MQAGVEASDNYDPIYQYSVPECTKIRLLSFGIVITIL